MLLKHYLKHKYFLRFKDRGSLERWQEWRVLRHMGWLKRHSPYYARAFARLELTNWRQLTMMDKRSMMEHFDDINTLGLSKEHAFDLALADEQSRDFIAEYQGVSIGMSSGTSGNRGLFLVSPKEQAAWAGVILAKMLPDTLLRPQRIALFLRANNKLYSSVTSRHIRFQFFDLFQPLETHLQVLDSYQPTILIGPPSVLSLLASWQGRKLAIAPRRIIAGAEVLEDSDRASIEAAFAQRPHEVYQATEGFLAATCSHGSLHFNEDIVHIEKHYIDDGKTRFMPIVTDFNRYSQAIVRYRLNDIILENPEACPCGSVMTRIAKIEGRSDDIFYLDRRDNKGRRRVFADYLRRAMFKVSRLEHYRVVQESPQDIRIHCEPRT